MTFQAALPLERLDYILSFNFTVDQAFVSRRRRLSFVEFDLGQVPRNSKSRNGSLS
jgi:hypothetical protein